MLRILRGRFLQLGRDEDGVAMVVTLAVFMFMYLVCMGVYAIGTAVKTRIHLQSACDAAAYSAAVVQADMLSRIATLNRAMAWTYIDVTRRQMDWISYRWLQEVCVHWQDDHNRAKEWAGHSSGECSLAALHLGNDWHCSPITLYGAENKSLVAKSIIDLANSGFHVIASSMSGQIETDWTTIEEMGKEIENLKREYSQKINTAWVETLMINVPKEIVVSARKCFYDDIDTFMEVMPNTDSEERRFVSYARVSLQDAFGNSGCSEGKWFERKSTSDEKGFRRGYTWGNKHALKATWNWHSIQWHCVTTPDGEIHVPTPCPGCEHPSHDVCACSGSLGVFSTEVLAENTKSKDGFYETSDRYRALPNKLKKEYFDKNGTITVGLAVKNQNPWTPILGSAIKGIFSAFNIGGTLTWTPQYTVCFASAKAGWKETLNWDNDEGVENDRGYRIDWEDGDWNLCQSDWDAVLIPVRRAESLASGRNWQRNVGSFLATYVESGLGVSRTNMKAGGDGLDVSAFYGGRLPGEEYRFGNDSGFWGGASPPVDQEPDDVRAKWQIGNPNAPVKWENLQKVMFH